MNRTNEFASGSNQPIYSGAAAADFMDGGWRKHSLGDNDSLRSEKEPGMQWGRYTALVPVSQLLRYREFDRTVTPKFSDTSSIIDSIANDLREKGPQGMRENVHLTYDHVNKWAYLSEGNHRLAAAIKAGLSHIPVTIHARGELDREKARGIGAPLHMDNRLHEKQTGYFPSQVHPGNFKEFEGAR